MTKRKVSAFNAFELLCISRNIEVGDTLLAQDEESKEFRFLWLGEIDRYSIFVHGEDGERRRFFTASLESKDGLMIVDLAKNPLSLKDITKKS